MELRWALAVVTGGGSGLGRELAVGLSRRGASVLVGDLDVDAAEETAELVRAARVTAWALRVDVCDETDRILLARRARDLGGADVLVNNAGGWSIGEQYPAAPYDAWSAAIQLNLVGPMRLTQLFLDDLEHRQGRRTGTPAVVNIASSAGVETSGYGSPEYAASKAGLVRFTSAMAAQADRVRVMAVVPGWIGLERAQRQWAELSDEQRATLRGLVPPAEISKAVADLVQHGDAGQVVELL